MEEFFYKADDGMVQGPYNMQHMQQWYINGYFHESLPIKVGKEGDFVSMEDLIHVNGPLMPFYSRNAAEKIRQLIDDKDNLIMVQEKKLSEVGSKFDMFLEEKESSERILENFRITLEKNRQLLEDNDSFIVSQQKQIDDLRADIEQLVEEKEAAVRNGNASDNLLKGNRRLLEEKNEMISSLNKEIGRLQANIKQMLEDQKLKDDEVREYKRNIEEKRKSIDEKYLDDSFLSIKAMITSLSGEIVDLQNEIKQLVGDLKKKDEVVDDYKRVVEENRKSIDESAELKSRHLKQIDEFEIRIDELERKQLSSNSEKEAAVDARVKEALNKIIMNNKKVLDEKNRSIKLLRVNNLTWQRESLKIFGMASSFVPFPISDLMNGACALKAIDAQLKAATEEYDAEYPDESVPPEQMNSHTTTESEKIEEPTKPDESNASADLQPEALKNEALVSLGVNTEGSSNAVMIDRDVLTHILMLATWSSNSINKYQFRESIKRVLMYVSKFFHEFCWEFDEKSIREKEINLKSLFEATTAGDIHAIEDLLDFVED